MNIKGSLLCQTTTRDGETFIDDDGRRLRINGVVDMDGVREGGSVWVTLFQNRDDGEWYLVNQAIGDDQ